MSEATAAPRPSTPSPLRFVWRSLGVMTDGPLAYVVWMIALFAVALLGINAWARQVSEGLIVTGMTDQVLWGLYIANFTFFVGVAAGAVMMTVPAHLFGNRDALRTVVIGEILAVAAVTVCLLFVIVDLGRPDRLWHLVPLLGRLHWPASMLAWDVVVLGGYLLLNLFLAVHSLHRQACGAAQQPHWHRPVIVISAVWAISIHTVTAFILCGMASRPLWNTALMAPRFLASAFVSAPALLIITLLVIRRLSNAAAVEGSVRTLLAILRVTVLINLFLLGCELFTVLYTGTAHAESMRYLLFGIDGHSRLVPWFWAGLALNAAAAVLLLQRRARDGGIWLGMACAMTFAGVWIEKGLALIVPGFIPSPIHEIVEYSATGTEWMITAGLWAIGLMIFSAGLRVALPLIRDRGEA